MAFWNRAAKAAPAALSRAYLVDGGQVRAIQTDDDILQMLGVGTGADGLPLDERARAFAYPASAACLRLISNLVASAPVHCFQRVGNDTSDRRRDHPAERLMNDFASPWMPSTEFVRLMTLEVMFKGEAFARVLRARGKPAELNILTACSVEYDEYTGEPSYKITAQNGAQEVLSWRDVVHVISPTGSAPVKQAARAIDLGLALEQSALRLFKNGGRPAGILTFATRVDDKTAAAARKAWNEDKDIAGGVPVLGADMKFTPMTMTSTDAEHSANRQMQVLEVSRHFGVPPTLLSHLEDATLANVEHLFRQLLTTCIDPYFDAWRGALTRCLLSDAERKAGFYIEHETADLTSADLKTTAEAIEKEVGGPTMTPNEGRKLRNLPPIYGGDALYPPRGAASPSTGNPTPAQ